MMVPAISRPRIQGKAGMPKLYETDFQSTGLRPTASFRIKMWSGDVGCGMGDVGVSSKERVQPWEQERTRRASVRLETEGELGWWFSGEVEERGGVDGVEKVDVDEAEEVLRKVSLSSELSSEKEAGAESEELTQPAPRTTSCVEGTRSLSAASRSACV